MNTSVRIIQPLFQWLLFQANRLSGGMLLSLVLISGLLAQPVLVKDINLKSSVVPENLTNVNGMLFFTSLSGAGSWELWKSDGTSGGTMLVKVINPGPKSAFVNPAIGELTNVNGILFFKVINETNGDWELWKSDGTGDGTTMVKNILSFYLTNVNGTLFFAADDGTHGSELWKSDGTNAGTVMVKDVNPGGESSFSIDPQLSPSFTNVNGTLFFTTYTTASGRELWRSDGTGAGTVMVKDIYSGSDGTYPNSSSPADLTNVKGTLFFGATKGKEGYELWKSDGTRAGTVMVRDIASGEGNSMPRKLTNVDGTLFFIANDGELWKSDGTSRGTVFVKNINISSFWDPVKELADVNGTLFFSAGNATSGYELWKSNGTGEGTIMVRDINPDPQSPSPKELTNVDGTLFFTAYNGASGYALWQSDGTPEGTIMVRDGYKGAGISFGNSFSPGLTAVNDLLFFTAIDSTSGPVIWKSDGTRAGTLIVKDVFAGSDGSFHPISDEIPASLTNVNGLLFFNANDGVNGYGLWKSDGTGAGTVLVKNILPGSRHSFPAELTYSNGTLFFTALHGTNGWELWKSDGTEAGTVLVKDINPGGSDSSPQSLTNVNGTLFFTANNGTNGYELWKSDGTEAGTVLVKDIGPGSLHSLPVKLTDVNGTLFFTAQDEPSGAELWQSDGTAAGTVMLKDIYEGGSSNPVSLTNVNGTLFFIAGDGTSGEQLWKSDGTSQGTVVVKDSNGAGPVNFGELTDVNGTLFFTASNDINGRELWKSDGTEAGTVLVKDINPGESDSAPQNLVNVNGTLFFFAFNETNGGGLWKSDGTRAGTVRVKDIAAGQGIFRPQKSTHVNGTLFFVAYDGSGGYELWQSDGTPEGTGMVGDIGPGLLGSFPGNLTHINGTLFFTADDGLRGRELWKYTPAAAPAPAAFRINAGGEAYTDEEGKVFIADQYANSGRFSTQVTADIAHTQDDALYQQGRVGERFTYSLPTGNGVYYVVLHFAETYWGNLVEGGAGSRRFNVDMEQHRKLTDYDIYAKAGGSLKAVQEAFRVVVKDSVLNIHFSKGAADLPLISAIEVFAEDAFRINVAGSAYYSSKGWFLSDAYYGGGSVSDYAPGAVAGTEDDELYRSNRHSSLFHYNLPTGPGQFQVTLHFNETYWGNLVAGGAGSRRFNVNAEEERKLSGYDTYQRAEGAMRAKQEQFSVTVTDQILSLAFLRGSADHSFDFAHVAAIEVVRLGNANARLAIKVKEQETPGLSLYPNPVKHSLTIQVSLPAGEIKTTSIRDALGRTLLTNAHQAVNQHQLQVDVNSLKPGLYLLQVQTQQGERVLKFIKQ